MSFSLSCIIAPSYTSLIYFPYFFVLPFLHYVTVYFYYMFSFGLDGIILLFYSFIFRLFF
ncbi:hypothetical protein CLU79DRAFT_768607 [Phycomyces nitens]|nr:hypothetical protein CLU79DRAFT_768607 [Phycomyces nitens]